MLKIAFALCAILLTLGSANAEPTVEVIVSFTEPAELVQLKKAGLVEEKLDGYLGVVNPPASPEVEDVIKRENQRRHEIYHAPPEEGTESSLTDSAELTQLKRAGLVGEKQDGYLGVVNPPASPEIENFIKRENQKRLETHQATAKADSGFFNRIHTARATNKLPPVSSLYIAEMMSAAVQISALELGMYFQDGAGNWIKK